MFRRVITPANSPLIAAAVAPTAVVAVPTSPGPTPDDFLAKLVKILPTETVTAYLIIDGALRSLDGGMPLVLLWVSFVVLLLLTYPYILQRTAVPGLPPARLQALVTAIGFAVWVFATGGPFNKTWPAVCQPYLGTVVLALYSAAAPLVLK